VAFEPKHERVVRDFEPQRIIKPGSGNYEFTREKFGPLAASDGDRVIKSTRDSRFRVSELSREPLSLHVEEQRAFEERVKRAVDALSAEAFEAARKAGMEEGRSAGLAEAIFDARAEAQALIDSFASMVESIESHRQRLLAQQERFLMEVVLKIARRICLKEISIDPTYFSRLAHALVEQCGSRDNIRVRISVQDADSIASLKKELSERIAGLKTISIEASAEVQPGACEVDTDLASFSASVASQLDAIEKAMFGQQSSDIAAAGATGTGP
jgi:flagellar biosynthesis/type III secretory pathway protein FliH